MISQLDIYVDKDLLNPKILTVRDTSYYEEDYEVTGGLLEISYPGSNVIVEIDDVLSGFFQIINSNTLGITNAQTSSNLADLPDGIWTLRYSIDPNDELFVEYTFLRNTLQMVDYVNAYCKLDIRLCEEKHYKEKLEKLKDIYNLIKAAEYYVDCCRNSDAIKVYNKASQLLEEFHDDCHC